MPDYTLSLTDIDCSSWQRPRLPPGPPAISRQRLMPSQYRRASCQPHHYQRRLRFELTFTAQVLLTVTMV